MSKHRIKEKELNYAHVVVTEAQVSYCHYSKLQGPLRKSGQRQLSLSLWSRCWGSTFEQNSEQWRNEQIFKYWRFLLFKPLSSFHRALLLLLRRFYGVCVHEGKLWCLTEVSEFRRFLGVTWSPRARVSPICDHLTLVGIELRAAGCGGGGGDRISMSRRALVTWF